MGLVPQPRGLALDAPQNFVKYTELFLVSQGLAFLS